MQPTKEDLAAQYDKLSNSELLKRVQSGTLVPLAHEVACEELRSRGVEFEKPNEHGESQDQDTDAEVDAHSDIASRTSSSRQQLEGFACKSEPIKLIVHGRYSRSSIASKNRCEMDRVMNRNHPMNRATIKISNPLQATHHSHRRNRTSPMCSKPRNAVKRSIAHQLRGSFGCSRSSR